jgi:hypothetical protein
MAGEKKGKAYEAFAKVALDSLRSKGRITGDIFWDAKPKGMTIIPDLTVGEDQDHPHTVILITHSGSAKNSDMKYWRNMGELVEAKILLPKAPKVFNLAFDSIIKEKLKLAQAASFDGQLLVGDLKYGAQLQKWIQDNLSRLPKEKLEKVDFLKSEAKSDASLRGLLISFCSDLEALLKKKAPVELGQIWSMERKRPPIGAPGARNTFVRRGLSKLLIFEDVEVAIRLFSGKVVRAEDVPVYAYELGLASKFTARGHGIAKPADEEISNALATLGEKSARRVIAHAPIEKVAAWLTSLRNSAHMTTIRNYLTEEYESLIDPSLLLAQLEKLHKIPSSFIDPKIAPLNWPPKSVWLFEVLLEVPKLLEDDPTSYGYAQLEQDCEKLKDMPKAGDSIYRTTIPGWVHRRPGVIVPHNVLKGICRILSGQLSKVGSSEIAALLSDEKLRGYFENIIEAKLCTYRMFEPLRLIIENSVHGTLRQHVRSCFGEKAGLDGQATKTTVLGKGKTLINWQSASDAGRDHKKKELCGRAVALRYSWDVNAKKFIRRPNVEKLILVVDGTWRSEDLFALARAGWDEIFYPDEMDRLVKAIV